MELLQSCKMITSCFCMNNFIERAILNLFRTDSNLFFHKRTTTKVLQRKIYVVSALLCKEKHTCAVWYLSYSLWMNGCVLTNFFSGHFSQHWAQEGNKACTWTKKLVQNIRTHLTFTINNVLFSRFISQLFIPLNGLVKLNRGTLHLIELLNHN